MSATRIPETVLAANLQSEAVLLHMDSRRYYQLNETGQFIWKLLEQGKNGAEIVAQIVATYDVSRDVATAEYERLIGELGTHGLVESSEDRG